MQTLLINHSGDVRYIASKVAADLKRLQRFYGNRIPTNAQIDDFQEEMAFLLNNNYLVMATYDFKENGHWIIAIKYQFAEKCSANSGGIKIPNYETKAYFSSLLTYSKNWVQLTPTEMISFTEKLPLQRTPTKDNTPESFWVADKNYAAGKLGIIRSMLSID